MGNLNSSRLFIFPSLIALFARKSPPFPPSKHPLPHPIAHPLAGEICFPVLSREMVSPENTNWLFDYGLIEDIPVPDGSFPAPASGFSWPLQALNGSSNPSVEIDGSFGDSDGPKDGGSKKRVRSESCGASSSKACREKLRRDKLNDKFLELGSILEPGRPPKSDKAAILIDAVRMVTQLRGEAQKLKDTNSNLQEKIKELKAEKNELRDEKQRLKAEKEKLEQQIKAMSGQPSFLPPPPAIPAAFAAQGQPGGNKLVPFIGYPGVAMWQFMPPAAVDTSQDHVLRPPVA
ncbi:transcription factor ILR3 [Malania oleifera]|uniref:transcription factor ILR3 n=1 Tax=Malania oleifera TaxID=397392 RepID=UPI0025ADAA76|nr:transcription factor ILR3 [Malania oleifera]